MHKDPISLNDLVIGLNRLTKTLIRFNYLSVHLAPDFLHWVFQSIPILSAKAAYQPEAYNKALPYQTETQLYRSLEYLLHDLPKGMCLPHMAQRLIGYKRWVSDHFSMVYGMPITDSRTTYMFTEPSLNPDSADEPSYVFADDHDAVLEMIDLDTLENAVQQAVEGVFDELR